MNFKTIIDTAAIGIIIVDNEGRITIANEQVAQFFGYTRTELLDLSVSELIPKEFRERHGQHLAAYFKNPISRPMGSGLELIGLKQDGTQFPLEISLSAIQAEELVLGVAFIVDITKRKQAEERFKMMIDTASVGVLVVQQGGKIVIANQLCANYFQYQQAELSNMSLEDLLPDEVRNNHKNYMEQFFSNPKPRPMGMGLELLAQKRDGTQFPVEISLSTVKVDDGVLGVAFIADITKRKQFEDQQFKAVEKLITDVGHDLKTPMAAITSRLHVLKYSLQEELHPHADVLEQHVRRLDKLIENLMIMARLDTRDNIPLTKSDLSLLLRFVVDDKQKDARNKHINLTHDIDDNLPDIYFNENFLFEALAHLVHNAIIFTSQGGAVHVCTENHDNTISIIISDTGVGIPEDQIPYIFDRFYRVDTSRPMDSALNGLGLAMVKRIIELHNGNINVKSVVGEGSTFEVILPKTP